MVNGAFVIAEALKSQGVDYLFGVVGIPIIEVSMACQAVGITYIGCRNEQAASYAANAVGFLTGRPGACIAVSGPGVVHALAGLANAQVNAWPTIVIGGASDFDQDGLGAFQESPQLTFVQPYVKYACQPKDVETIPQLVEKCVRTSISGRPGAVYIDLSGSLVNDEVDDDTIVYPERCADPPKTLASPDAVSEAVAAIKAAERPLIIVGQHAAYNRAETEIRRLAHSARVPVITQPMAKGVVSDADPLSVAPARSLALQEADVVVLIGSQLDWMLHFGRPPRYAKDVKFVQLAASAELLDAGTTGLVGDLSCVAGQLADSLSASGWHFPASSPWWKTLHAKCDSNRDVVRHMMEDNSNPMGYYRAFKDVRSAMDDVDKDVILVSEGANTMDISRSILGHKEPRHRLDAGVYGTMGVGMGFAMAAAAVFPDSKVVWVCGDSAFGFSCTELETAARFSLNITTVIINNNGIYSGVDELPEEMEFAPVTSLLPKAHYERIVEAFGGRGFFVDSPGPLLGALREALAISTPTVVNVCISPTASRKPQKHEWLTRSKL